MTILGHTVPHHIYLCKQILSIMKYIVNRGALVGNVGESDFANQLSKSGFLPFINIYAITLPKRHNNEAI